MHIQGKLIERALLKSGLESYGALARHLGVTAATMSQWRSGDSKLSNERVEQLAKLSNDDPGIWAIALMAEEPSVSYNLKSSIQRILKTSGGFTLAALCAMGLALPNAGKAHQIDISPYPSGGESGSMHIM